MTFETYTQRSRQARVQPGMRLGPYEILLCVARGGMASVWAARQHGARGFSRLVALKTVLPELAAPDLDMMFLDEARVSARIHHPNVCEVFELIEHQGALALSMEWVDGDTACLSIAFTWLLDHAFSRALWYRALGYKVRAGGPALVRPIPGA